MIWRLKARRGLARRTLSAFDRSARWNRAVLRGPSGDGIVGFRVRLRTDRARSQARLSSAESAIGPRRTVRFSRCPRPLRLVCSDPHRRKQAEPERPVYRASTTSGGVVRVDHGSGGGGQGSGIGGQGSGVGDQGSGVGGQGSGAGGQGSEVGGERSGGGGRGLGPLTPPLAAGGSASGYGNSYGPSAAGGGGPFGMTAAGSGFPSGTPGGNFATGAVGSGNVAVRAGHQHRRR